MNIDELKKELCSIVEDAYERVADSEQHPSTLVINYITERLGAQNNKVLCDDIANEVMEQCVSHIEIKVVVDYNKLEAIVEKFQQKK